MACRVKDRGALSAVELIAERGLEGLPEALTAALRWNRTQKLNANDIFDFHHAGAALGYCDVLLTGGPMHTLLMQRHLAIERDFPCRVVSSVEEAADWARHRIACVSMAAL